MATINHTEDKYILTVDTTLYSKSAITATLYRYSGDFFISEEVNSENPNCIDISFEQKTNTVLNDKVLKQILNDIIDQQLRVNINERFGHIRDLIVEEAFKPISQK